MIDSELLSRLRTATVADPAWVLYEIMNNAADELEQSQESTGELMGIIAEQAYEINRLKTIIRNYYAEEQAYSNQCNDRIDPDFTIPQTWKDAYRAFEAEAFSIEEEEYDH